MLLLDLNNDVNTTISRHLSNDMNISKMFTSKDYDLQKILVGEIVFDDDFNGIEKTPDRISADDSNDSLNTGKMHKISNGLNDILCRGVTCNALKTC